MINIDVYKRQQISFLKRKIKTEYEKYQAQEAEMLKSFVNKLDDKGKLFFVEQG